ncbi:MAGUK p55 subfamily member 7-like [Ochotona princeps]|uniref:MAGUK p55 subfamily member 7-like n=1 Tax=Ochotona princeps TaxID=9978 RepID=UPI00271479E9|nr:MAGUK p55 subfamily member 7-like [Ochotona princeps]
MPALAMGSGSDTGLYELLAALPAQLQPHVDSQEDLTFLWDVFGEKSLHSLVKVKPYRCQILFTLASNVEKHCERHQVNPRWNCHSAHSPALLLSHGQDTIQESPKKTERSPLSVRVGV